MSGMLHFYKYFENCTDIVHANKTILSTIPPILLIVGTLGNVISILVLMRKDMRKVPSYNYLTALSAADTFVLYSGLLKYYLEQVHGIGITNQIFCKLDTFLNFVLMHYSVWLIIAVTAERYVVTAYSLQAQSICTRRNSRLVMATTLGVLVCINFHLLFTVTSETFTINNVSHTECPMAIDKHRHFVEDIWPFVDAIIYSFGPFIILSTLNSLIIRNVRASRNIIKTSSRSKEHEELRLSVMLVTISFVFLLTTMPVNITMVVVRSVPRSNSLCTEFTFTFTKTVVTMLMYTNHSINFFLYLVSGHKFRLELRKMLGFGPKPERYSSIRQTAVS